MSFPKSFSRDGFKVIWGSLKSSFLERLTSALVFRQLTKFILQDISERYLPQFITILRNSETARHNDVTFIPPNFIWFRQSHAKIISIRFVESRSFQTRGCNDVVGLHKKNVYIPCADFRAVTIARERPLDFYTARFFTLEKTVELHVLFLRVEDYSIRRVMAKHQLAHIGTVTFAAIEHAVQSAALCPVVAVEAFCISHVRLQVLSDCVQPSR